MRYSSNESKVYLKSERYLADDSNHSMVSHDRESSAYKSQKESAQEGHSGNRFAIKPAYRKSGISHYRRDEILKNKVDISTSNLAGIKSKHSNNRPNTTLEQKQNAEED